MSFDVRKRTHPGSEALMLSPACADLLTACAVCLRRALVFDESNICTVLDELIKVDTKAAQVEVMKLDSLYKELRAKKKAREDVKDVEKQIEEEAVLYRRVEAQKERLNSRKGATCGGSFFYSG